MRAGTFVTHYAKQVHWDGAKDEETIIFLSGEGPATTTRVEEEKSSRSSAGLLPPRRRGDRVKGCLLLHCMSPVLALASILTMIRNVWSWGAKRTFGRDRYRSEFAQLRHWPPDLL